MGEIYTIFMWQLSSFQTSATLIDRILTRESNSNFNIITENDVIIVSSSNPDGQALVISRQNPSNIQDQHAKVSVELFESVTEEAPFVKFINRNFNNN
jgi:hypothetical protein